MILATASLVMMVCVGDPRDQNCGDEFIPESWVAATKVLAKKECERFLREDFDPTAYVYLDANQYVAVRCEA